MQRGLMCGVYAHIPDGGARVSPGAAIRGVAHSSGMANCRLIVAVLFHFAYFAGHAIDCYFIDGVIRDNIDFIFR